MVEMQERPITAGDLRRIDPEGWDSLERSQLALRINSLKLLNTLMDKGITEAGILHEMLVKRSPAHEVLPVSLDDISLDLEGQYEKESSPITKSLASFAHAASFVVGAETVHSYIPNDPNLPVLRQFAEKQIDGASISELAKTALREAASWITNNPN